MKPYVMSELEEHLVTVHGVDAILVAQVRERFPERHSDISKHSHDVMHQLDPEVDHAHD